MRWCSGLAAAALFSASAAAHAVELLASSEVRAGMEGYGLTVFEGTKIERFKVKVISVLKNSFPKMDMILIRCFGPKLEHSGIVAGMSGSPIYLQVDGKDRLIGALAYGWMFSKDPVAGVTPIHHMLDEAKRPLRQKLVAGLGSIAHPQLKPAATPLFVSGLAGPVLQAVTPELEKWNFLPLQGAAAGASAEAAAGEKVELEPGAAIGVQFMRGDIEMIGVGTVTHRDGDTVFAFGHPMLGIGELQFPITTAYVHHVFAGMARSFKMAGAIAPAGTLVQDRRPVVIGKLGPQVPLIPVRLEVSNPMARRRDVYNLEVVHHKQFTPILVLIGMLNSIQTSASDQTEVSFTASLRLKLPGREPIVLQDELFSPSGIGGFGLFASPVFRGLMQLYANPFEEIRAERVDYKIELLFKRDLAQIEGVRFATDALRPGALAKAWVRLRPFLGVPFEKEISFLVPDELEGQEIALQIAGGPNAPVDQAPPDNFDHVVQSLARRHPSKSIVVTMQVPSQGLKIRGSILPDLPRTELEKLLPANATGLGLPAPGLRQAVIAAEHVIVGSHQVRMRVKRALE